MLVETFGAREKTLCLLHSVQRSAAEENAPRFRVVAIYLRLKDGSPIARDATLGLTVPLRIR